MGLRGSEVGEVRPALARLSTCRPYQCSPLFYLKDYSNKISLQLEDSKISKALDPM